MAVKRNIALIGFVVIVMMLTTTTSMVVAQSSNQLNLDPAQYGISTQPGQHEVYAVYSHDGSSCGKFGSKYVFLRSHVETLDEFVSGSDDTHDIAEIRQNLEQKLGSDVILVMSSSKADIDETTSALQQIETSSKLNMPRCEKLWVPDGAGYYFNLRTYMFAENTDAGSYTDDNGQGVWMVSPVYVGSSMNGFVYVSNNVKTNGAGPADLQVGLYFTNNLGQVVFANNSTNLLPYTFGVDYYPGNSYQFVNTFTNGVWWQCARNGSLGNYTWRCVQVPTATGNNLHADIFTSVFLEHSNSNTTWRSGFPSNLAVGAATIVRNGYHYPWSTMHKHSGWNCLFGYASPYAGMSGNLAASGALWYELAQIPSTC